MSIFSTSGKLDRAGEGDSPSRLMEHSFHRRYRCLIWTVGFFAWAASGTVQAEPKGSLSAELELCRPAAGAANKAALSRLASKIEKGADVSTIKSAQTLREQYPEDAVVAYYLARAERALGHKKKAEQAARDAYGLNSICAPIALLWGEMLEASKASDDAVDVYSKLLRHQPDQAQIRLKLAKLLVSQSELDLAEPHLRKLARAFPEDAEAQAAWAELQGWRGVPQDCVVGFDRAIALKPKVMSRARLATYAAALRQLGQLEKARKQYVSALGRAPGDVGLLVGTGQVYVDLGRAPEGVEYLRRAVSRAPKDQDVRAGLARALQAAGKEGEAARAYKKAIELDPKNDKLRVEAVQVIAGSERRRDMAIELIKPLVERPDARPEHVLAMAEIMGWEPARRKEALDVLDGLLAKEHDLEAAWTLARQIVLWIPPSADLLPWLQRLNARHPKDEDVTMHLASSLSRDPARAMDAIRAFDRVLALDPGRGEARIAAAELKLQQGTLHAEALMVEFRRGAEQTTDNADLQSRAAYGLLRLGKTEESLRIFDYALGLKPGHFEATMGKAEALFQLGRSSEGEAFLDRAIADTKDGRTRADYAAQKVRLINRHDRDRARALATTGKATEAEAAYRKVLRASPRDVDAWVSLGALEASRHDYEAALRSFRRALAIEPKHLGALQGASGALVALDKFAEAKSLLEKELEINPSGDARKRLRRLEVLLEVSRIRKLEASEQKEVTIERLGRLFLEAPDEAVVVTAYAQALYDADKYAEAAEAYGRILRKEPENVPAMRGAASAMWRAGRRAEARATLIKASTFVAPPERAELEAELLSWTVEEAEAAKSRGDFAKALDLYREAYAKAPSKDYVLKGIAGLYWTNGQTTLASKFFHQAALLYPDDEEAIRGTVETLLQLNMSDYAVTFLDTIVRLRSPLVSALREKSVQQRDLRAVDDAWRRGDKAIAVNIATEATKRHPDSVEPWMRLARLYGLDGNHLEAVRCYHQALELSPDNQPALLALIATLQTMGRVPEAIDLIRQARSRDQILGRVTPELSGLEAAVLARQARDFEEKGELEAALAMYERALILEPAATWILMRMAQMYFSNDQLDPALALYTLAVEREPFDREAVRGKALVLLNLDRLDEAQRALEKLRELDRSLDRSQDLARMGSSRQRRERSRRQLEAELLKKQGELPSALAIYEKLFAEKPEDVDVARGLVGCYLALDRPVDALSLLTDLLVEHPFEPEFLKSASVALGRLSRSDLAVPVLRKANRYWPSSDLAHRLHVAYIEAYVEAAEAAKVQGETAKARAWYEEALRRDPENMSVIRGLAGVEATDRRFDEARSYYSTILRGNPDDEIAIVGYASTLSSRGQVQAAIDAMSEAWERTQAPRVGLELTKLYVNNGRYLEADRALRRVEAVLEKHPRYAARMAIEAAKDISVGPSPEEVVARFEEAWEYVSKLAPAERSVRVRKPLATPSLSRFKAVPPSPSLPPGSAPLLEAPTALSDIAPDLGLPGSVGVVALKSEGKAASTRKAGKRIDLWLVEQLLNSVRKPSREAPEGGMEEAGRAPGRGDHRVDHPERASDSVPGWGIARLRNMPADAWRFDAHVVEDTEDYSPFSPSISEEVTAPRPTTIVWDPVKETRALRIRLDEEVATRLRFWGEIDHHTGTRGMNAMISSFAGLALRTYPTPALYLEPFVMPGMVSDGYESQSGVMLGIELGAHTGPFGLSARVGSSPLGFVGGAYPIGVARIEIGVVERLELAVEGGVEPIRDSVWSWAGREDAAGMHGRVSRSRLGFDASLMLDSNTRLSLGGDMGQYSGLDVAANDWGQGQLNFDHGMTVAEDQEVHLGLDITAFGFGQQLDLFESGQGGYFSPALFIAAKGRGSYEGRSGDGTFRYRGMLDLGAQYTDCLATDMCMPGSRAVVTLEADLGYRISRGLECGLRYIFDNVGADYTRNVAWLYLEKRFGLE